MQTAAAARALGENDWGAIQKRKAVKVWALANGWTQNKLAALADTIRNSVIQEVLLRDNREYDIAEDGGICTLVSPEEPATGVSGHYETDIVKASQKSPPGEINNEATRRTYAWMALRPLVAYVNEWRGAIIGDDGKDDRGEWLCGPHHGGKSGFGQQMPAYIRSPNPEWCDTNVETENDHEEPRRGGLELQLPRRGRGRPPGSKNKVRQEGSDG